MHTGSCLCGAIRFSVNAKLGPVDACHCTQCRKWTGHFLPSAGAPLASLVLESDKNLRWYESSKKARRGFCNRCGSSLFFDPLDKTKHDWIGISLGAFDGDVGVTLDRHIFVAEKGDYYAITDGLPQNDY